MLKFQRDRSLSISEHIFGSLEISGNNCSSSKYVVNGRSLHEN